MLLKNVISSWHRVNSADEIRIYLKVTPINLKCLDNYDEDSRNLRIDTNNPIEMILSGYWQAARSSGEFTLDSCCECPGFDF